MDILVACEESQVVTNELRKLGHNAYSCDLQDCSGGHSEWHIKDDVMKIINNGWDMIIAFPPCTYLSKCCNNLYNEDKYGDKARQRKIDRELAINFFMEIVNARCNKIAIENPIGVMSTRYRKPDQIIQPWMFGDPFEKRTCIWLKNLPKLRATEIVEPPPRVQYRTYSQAKWFDDAKYLPTEERRRVRSRTFDGIGKAMAMQFTE